MNTIRHEVQYIIYISVFFCQYPKFIDHYGYVSEKVAAILDLEKISKCSEKITFAQRSDFLFRVSEALCKLWCFCLAGKYIFAKEPDYCAYSLVYWSYWIIVSSSFYI